MNLENFFNPQKIAIVGASNDKNKVGYSLVANLKQNPDKKIFPISLAEKEIQGLKAFTSISEIAEDIDLVLIAVRNEFVPKIIAECAIKKVKDIIVISAGFKEIGPKGIDLENQITKLAKEMSLNILGPNCLGTMDGNANFNASFTATKPLSGNIALLSQSGALGTAMLDWAAKEGVGFSKFISLGNEACLNELDFLEYLGKDEATKSILIYMEKVSDGKRFMSLAKEITKTKPIVVLRAGRSARGMSAVASHTGSLAPESSVFEAACHESGIITVDSIREFYNMAKLFQLGILKPLSNLVILTNGGGPSVVTADLVDLSKSLSLVQFGAETKEALKKVLPEMAAINNPIDIIGDALADRYRNSLEIIANIKEVDAILLMLTPQMMTQIKETAELVISFGTKKPIISIFMGGEILKPALEVFMANKITTFYLPKDAIEALDNLNIETKKKQELPKTLGPQNTLSTMMSFAETKKLFAKYGLKLDGDLVEKRSEIIHALHGQGSGPYAMKLVSSNVIHKTDSHAVILNIKSVTEAQHAFDQLVKINDGKDIEGVLVQAMGKGREIIIGMKRDENFGPTILFGMGGVLAEVIKDTSIRIAPVSRSDAMNMMQEIKGFPVLNGYRGDKKADLDSLAEIVEVVSKISLENENITEIDINPVMVTNESASLIDVRVMVL